MFHQQIIRRPQSGFDLIPDLLLGKEKAKIGITTAESV